MIYCVVSPDRFSFSYWHATLFPLDFLPSAEGSDHLSPKAVPRYHRKLFSSFYLLPSSVFLALQQRSGPSNTLHSPSSSALGCPGDWLPELAEAGAVTSPPHFAASRPLQSMPMSQARVHSPRAPGTGPWVPARRRRPSAGAHSVISLVH